MLYVFLRGSMFPGRTRNKSPGAPSFAFFAKGGIPRISIPTVAYPTLCKDRKGWATRLFVVLPAVPNTHRCLIEELFLLRKPHTLPTRLFVGKVEHQLAKHASVLLDNAEWQERFAPVQTLLAKPTSFSACAL
jgi:hypothetical protein